MCNVQRAPLCHAQPEPNIIKYQFKLTQQQFKPTAAATATTTATNTRRLAEKIKLVQKCKHVVCRMLHVLHVSYTYAYNEEGDSPDM